MRVENLKKLNKHQRRRRSIDLSRKVKSRLIEKGIDVHGCENWPELYRAYTSQTGRKAEDCPRKAKHDLLFFMENDGIWDMWSAFDSVSRNPIKTCLGSKRSFNSLRKVPFAKKERATQSQAQKFYQTHEWTSAKQQILQLYGLECMACNATPKGGAVIVVDHIRPLRFYWGLRLDLNNLQVLCSKCNRQKGSQSEIDLRPDPRMIKEVFAA